MRPIALFSVNFSGELLHERTGRWSRALCIALLTVAAMSVALVELGPSRQDLRVHARQVCSTCALDQLDLSLAAEFDRALIPMLGLCLALTSLGTAVLWRWGRRVFSSREAEARWFSAAFILAAFAGLGALASLGPTDVATALRSTVLAGAAVAAILAWPLGRVVRGSASVTSIAWMSGGVATGGVAIEIGPCLLRWGGSSWCLLGAHTAVAFIVSAAIIGGVVGAAARAAFRALSPDEATGATDNTRGRAMTAPA